MRAYLLPPQAIDTVRKHVEGLADLAVGVGAKVGPGRAFHSRREARFETLLSLRMSVASLRAPSQVYRLSIITGVGMHSSTPFRSPIRIETLSYLECALWPDGTQHANTCTTRDGGSSLLLRSIL